MRSQLTLIGKGNPDDCCWQKADNAGLGSNKFSVSKWRLIFEPEITSFSSFLGPHSQIFSHAQAAWPLENSMHLSYCAELFSRDQNKKPSINERQVKLWNKSRMLSSLGMQHLEQPVASATLSAKLVSAAEQFCPVSIFISLNDFHCQVKLFLFFSGQKYIMQRDRRGEQERFALFNSCCWSNEWFNKDSFKISLSNADAL